MLSRVPEQILEGQGMAGAGKMDAPELGYFF